MTLRIKICGITSIHDAEAAAAAGTDYIGLVLSDSPRRVSLERARDIVRVLRGACQCVGVFVDEPMDYVCYAADYCGLDVAQFQGTESPAYCRRSPLPVWKGIHLRAPLRQSDIVAYNVGAFLFDTFVPHASGGTGRTFDWNWVSRDSVSAPFFLAGGLNTENVADAIAAVQPDGVDVSSGVAVNAREKNPRLMNAFVQAARRAADQMLSGQPYPTKASTDLTSAHQPCGRQS